MLKLKRNQNKIRINDSCDLLLAKNFFRILETNEFRYLLDLDDFRDLPEYPEGPLQIAWDKVMREHEKDTGTHSYATGVMKNNQKVHYNSLIEGLEALKTLMFINLEKAKEYFAFFKIKWVDYETTLKAIKGRIQAIITNMDIHLPDKEEPAKNTTFYDVLFRIRKHVGAVDPNTLTVKDMNSCLMNMNKDGR